MITIYKIKDKDTGLYSHGVISRWSTKRDEELTIQKWSKKGKEWTSEVLVKKHLMACIELGGIPASWEIEEFTQQPSKELNKWIDAKMLVKILQIDHSKQK